MSPAGVAVFMLILTFGSYLLGGWVRLRHHGSLFGEATAAVINNSRMALLVLTMFSISAIMVSSKAGFETKSKDLRIQASKFIYLNQIFVEYGSKADIAKISTREFLKDEIDLLIDAQSEIGIKRRAITGGRMRNLIESVINLEASTELEKDLKSTALAVCHDITASKWLTLEELGSGILWPLIILLAFWLFVVFLSFGLISTMNQAELIYFFALSLCVSTAVYLPLELDLPFRGLIHVSYEPLLIASKILSQ